MRHRATKLQQIMPVRSKKKDELLECLWPQCLIVKSGYRDGFETREGTWESVCGCGLLQTSHFTFPMESKIKPKFVTVSLSTCISTLCQMNFMQLFKTIREEGQTSDMVNCAVISQLEGPWCDFLRGVCMFSPYFANKVMLKIFMSEMYVRFKK